MQMKDRTKIMFAQQLEYMLQTTPLDKIRVSKLCELCGAVPPTFYYYFNDKYELVAWIFLQDFAEIVGDKSPSYTTDALNAVTKQMEKRKSFYKKVFSDQSQNSITSYVLSFNLQISKEAIMKTTGEELTSDQLFAVKYHVNGTIGMFREWLFGYDITIEELNQHLYERTPDFLKEAFANYRYSTESILQKSGKITSKVKKI